MLRRPPAAALLAVILLATPAAASRVVVPDQSPTIQSALDIDAGVDTVAVRDGLPPERITISRYVVIEPADWGSPYVSAWTSAPLIQSMEIKSSSWGVEARGFRFLGKVITDQRTSGSITFEGCRFDSSFSDPGTYGFSFVVISVRGCMIFGPVGASGYVQFLSNTVIGGTVTIWADGGHDIRNNYIEGPADVGLKLSIADSEGRVAMNTVRGTTTGILVVDGGGVDGNDIADCAGDGIVFNPYSEWSVGCDSNRVARCGGAGIIVQDTGPLFGTHGEAKGNIVGNTGQGGIVLGPGVFCAPFSGNVVLDAGGDGITLGYAPSVEKNIVGRSHGAGFHVTQQPSHFAGNTAFGNGGPGIRLTGDTHPVDSLFNNVCAFNVGPGLSYESTAGGPHTGPPWLGCNDWFGNLGGACVGIAPGATDLELNPQFCNLPSADVHLAATSPLLAAPGCGLIGALGQGCAATTAVEGPVSVVKRFRAWPVPARGGIGFEIPPLLGAATLEVFDVAGARRWQTAVAAGATRLEWDRRDSSGSRAAPGVYFARLRWEGSDIATVRLVLAE